MLIMQSRQKILQWAYEGYVKTGIPLVGYDGTQYIPGGNVDDIGLHYFVPKIAALTGLPLNQAVNAFYYSLLAAAVVSGLIAGFFLFRHVLSRLHWSVMVLILGLIPVTEGDSYTMFAVATVGLAPWALYIYRHAQLNRKTYLVMALIGMLCGYSNFIRSHSATPVLLFSFILIASRFADELRIKRMTFLFLIVGFFIPRLMFDAVLARRDAFLRNNIPNYQPTLGAHPFWHNVYLGLAFLNNEYVPEGGDRNAKELVQKIAPGTVHYTPASEAILKREYFRIAREHPFFFIRTLFAKFGVMEFYVLVFANVGLWFAWKYRKPWPEDLAFGAAMAFHSLFGFLVTPYYFYVLGLISFAALWGVVSVAQKKSALS